MLLRGSNGSGKSVTMQSVVPLLLDGNMSPERLDPFGSRDRKMSSYLLEEDDKREERTGYLYLEFKRQDSETYLTIGMGIRARKGKPLDKWYFSLTLISFFFVFRFSIFDFFFQLCFIFFWIMAFQFSDRRIQNYLTVIRYFL